jgi:hypothetical protein
MAVDPSVRIDLAAEFTGRKAFRQADTATEKLTKSAKNLARTFGVAFSTAAVIGFAKKSINASIEAQAQQARLASLLRVTVGATDAQIASLDAQAAALEKVGVVSAGNITQTQSQLATFNLQLSTIEKLTPAILDYVTAEKGATATTEEFKSMTNGLAQALNGNFASLTKTGFVLDENTKSIIKNGTESERVEAIVAVLNSTYKDFNKNLRDTPVGQMAVLANAAQEASTIIGTSLLGALQSIGEDDSISNLANDITGAATSLANFVDSIVYLKEQVKSIPGAGIFGYLFSGVTDLLGRFSPQRLAELIKQIKGFQGMGNVAMTGGSNMDTQKFEAQQKKLANNKIAADKKAAANKIAADKKAAANKAKLDKAAAVFEIQKIQIAAALKGKISEEEKVRLLLMQAIEDGNADKAEALQKKLEDIQKQNAKIAADLLAISEAKDPFSTWAGSLLAAYNELNRLKGGMLMIPGVTFNPGQNKDRNYDLGQGSGGGGAGGGAAVDDVIESIFAEDDTIEAILEKVENVAAEAAAAAEAVAASVAETQVTVDALAEAATNGYGMAGTNFNPYQSRDRNYDSGYSNAPAITINIEGNVLDGDDFTEKVNDALLNANKQGMPRTAAGFLIT